ncbi:hypothetical protein [Streptomyces jumonjinensis]|uniref:ParB-like N-terminal domain-containing protein n=1 Tax=Streptomyces jumonjinensis TaxID=1945 RepID=A0A646KR97_STRJU|nr:hypothetical protein [Streptomyces jumonjinensis]MQT04391.1 hypothetical protein [Streptomyces jumonjinensis]
MGTNEQPQLNDGESSDYLIRLRDSELESVPVELVPTSKLIVAYTPRIASEDEEYVRILAESVTPRPPILVHRPTMTVIDGVHRLKAARYRSEELTAVRFFDGSVQDPHLLAVATNVTHGRSLSVADRAVAAERIFVARPQWSDRAVAAVAGLSAKKVAQIRRGFSAHAPELGHRIGRDGRTRPVSSAQGRKLASELIRQDPGASLRQIARRAGISPATVADVRERMSRGEDPLPPRQRLTAAGQLDGTVEGPGGTPMVSIVDGAPGPPRGTAVGVRPEEATGVAPTPCAEASAGTSVRPIPQTGAKPLLHSSAGPHSLGNGPRRCKGPFELLAIFDSLRRDPSLRLNEAGRNVLRMLDACASVVRDRRQIVDTVPAHCKEPMSQLADGYAEIWQLLADDLRRDGIGAPIW